MRADTGNTKSILVFLLLAATVSAADPVVSNVRASQRPGTSVVDILYDVTGGDLPSLSVSIRVPNDGGATWAVPCTTVAGSGVGPGGAPGPNRTAVWDAGADWAGHWSNQMTVEVTATEFVDAGGYLLVDLSDGSSAENYPVAALDTVPAGGWTDVHKTTVLVLRRVPAGIFAMGSPEGELGGRSDEDQHSVVLTEDFCIGVFEVTQKQWERVMDWWPSCYSNTAYREPRPVDQVSWDQVCGGFAQRLRDRTGIAFGLPTEAQWEYACRAGTDSSLNSGKDLTSVLGCPNLGVLGRYFINWAGSGTQDGDTSGGTAKVGTYVANARGLYDMHGNVRDWYGTYPGAVVDPVGPSTGLYRVMRGGGLLDEAEYCRSARRDKLNPTYYLQPTTGLRVCCPVPPDFAGQLSSVGPGGRSICSPEPRSGR